MWPANQWLRKQAVDCIEGENSTNFRKNPKRLHLVDHPSLPIDWLTLEWPGQRIQLDKQKCSFIFQICNGDHYDFGKSELYTKGAFLSNGK